MMKKYIIKIISSALLFLVIFSCSNQDSDRVFSESASERLNEAINGYSTSLKNTDNGWVLQYFPDNNQAYGGFNYTAKFEANNVTNILFELQNDLTTPVTSNYNVISYGGAVLTFDTYNTNLHAFSTPSAANYEALGGDFEFLIMSEEDNIINLRGNKTGNTMRLIKLTETPAAYLTKVKDVASFFSGASGAVTIGSTVVPVNLNNRHLSFTPEGGDPVNVAFIYTDEGIRLYQPTTINGKKAIDFTLNRTDNQLVSADGSVIIEIIKAPIDMEQDWTISTFAPDISQAFFNSYVQIYNANVQRWNEALSRTIFFGNTTVRRNTTPGIMFVSDNRYPAQYNLAFSGVLGESDQLNIVKVGGAFNWRFYAHLEPLVDFIVNNAPYTAQPNDPTNPTEVRLTSVANAEAWFVIKL